MGAGLPVRILATARDPGAAFQIGTIARRLAARPRFRVTCAAVGAAVPIFRDLGLAPEEIPEGDALARAAELLARHAPGFALCGQSGPDAGLDEAVVRLAACPKAVFQDFWGYAPPGFGAQPDLFLTLDAAAAERTRARTGRACAAVGSPRHDAYTAASWHEARAAGLPAFANDGLRLLFLGQPFAEWPAYRRTLDVAIAAARATPGARLHYLPHPKSPASHAAAMRDRLRREEIGEVIAVSRIEHAVAAADVVTTAFSSAAYDYVALARAAGEPFAPPLFLLWEDDLKRALGQYSDLALPPGVAEGYALAPAADDLVAAIGFARSAAAREAARRAAARLPAPGGATDRGVAAIEALLSEAA